MAEENNSNPEIASTNNVFLEQQERLLRIDQDLVTFNRKHDQETEECIKINRKIAGHSKKMDEAVDDIQVVHNIIRNLKQFNMRGANAEEAVPNDIFPELNILTDIKFMEQQKFNFAHKLAKMMIKKTLKQLQVTQIKLRVAQNDLKLDEETLSNYENLIYRLDKKQTRQHKEVKTLEEYFKRIVLTSVNDEHLETVANYELENMNRKIMFFDKTISSLQKTLEQFYSTKALIDAKKVFVGILEDQISQKNDLVGKYLTKSFYWRAKCKKVERHLKICYDVQNEIRPKEKIQVAEYNLYLLKKKFNDSKSALNNYKDKLFIQTLKIAIVKANIANALQQRDELEAQMAMEMSEH